MKWNNLTGTLERVGLEFKELYKNGILTEGVSIRGTLYNSVDYTVRTGGEGIGLFFEAADHWIWVENGRAAGKMPPVAEIQKWIIERGIPDKPGLAFLIARSIGRRGIRPRPVFKSVLEQKRAEWTTAVNRAIKQDIKQMIKDGKKDQRQI